jgi:hypothetical protein
MVTATNWCGIMYYEQDEELLWHYYKAVRTFGGMKWATFIRDTTTLRPKVFLKSRCNMLRKHPGWRKFIDDVKARIQAPQTENDASDGNAKEANQSSDEQQEDMDTEVPPEPIPIDLAANAEAEAP